MKHLPKKKVKFEEEEGKYYIELEFEAMGKTKISTLELTKFEPKDPIIELNDKIKNIENDIKNLSIQIEELKNITNNNNNMEEKIKEVIYEKDIKNKLFEEFEQMICDKYNLKNNKKEENEEVLIKVKNSINELMDIKLTEKVDGKQFNEKIKNIEDEFNKKIDNLNNMKNKLEKIENNYIDKINFIPQIDKNIQNNKLFKKLSDEINLLKNNNDNYIILKVKVDKRDKKDKNRKRSKRDIGQIGEKITFIKQNPAYKYFYNFERDDIEVIIDGENVSLEIEKRDENFTPYDKSSDCNSAQKLEYNLKKCFNFYWKFNTEGIHTIKIIFRKKLFNCDNLFNRCRNIIEIDISNFDCSQITSCKYMFAYCYSLEKINLGTLDFALSNNFEGMFEDCENLKELDVTHFNTKNSLSFLRMFQGCCELKKIDVSKFNSSKCKAIDRMFCYCSNIKEIDMINWNMSSIYIEKNNHGINDLFYCCRNLKNIKMSSNFGNIEEEIQKDNDIFKGLPDGGSFTWKKGINCNKLLSGLPVSWGRNQE